MEDTIGKVLSVLFYLSIVSAFAYGFGLVEGVNAQQVLTLWIASLITAPLAVFTFSCPVVDQE